ncbi:MAG TPA: ABC transporter permease subunit [Candidatus Acidoferrales bacterium]|nr:ABC transporter permease subunit [Candidatus Acidoferrales bacterium]
MFRKALWDLRWTTFWYAVGAASYTFLIALYFPVVRDQAATIQKLIATYPKALLALFGIRDLATFSGFMGAETLNLIWPAIILVFATMAGGAVVAKEVEDGTVELWLSVPARRWRLLLGKLAALAVGLLATVAACVIALVLGAALVHASLTPAGLLAMAAVMTAFLFTVGAYSCLLSSLTSSRAHAAGLSLGVTMASYLAWVVANLSRDWEWLKNVSVFTAYTPQAALEDGRLEAAPMAVLLLITALCALLAILGFERRDATA